MVDVQFKVSASGRRAAAPHAMLVAFLAVATVAACSSLQDAPGVQNLEPMTSAPPALSAGTELQAIQDGLVLTATVDSDFVEPTGQISVRATLTNTSQAPVVVFAPRCGGAIAGVATMGLPIDPAGRQWPGIAGVFKEYVLDQGYGPGAVAATAPVEVELHPESCSEGLAQFALAPGQVMSSVLASKPELVEGIPVPAGEVRITLTVVYLGPTQEIPDPRSVLYSPLTLGASIQVVGDSPRLAGMGEVIDSVLADPGFAAWLETRSQDTWSNANLFLVHAEKATGIQPVGSWWELDLFREIGVPRDSAIAFVDPFDAGVASVSYCDAPCD